MLNIHHKHHQGASRLRHALLLALTLLLLVATGCSLTGSGEGGGSTKTGGKQPRGTRPYTIRGKTYYPLLSAEGFREDGLASWYGSDFHGKKTANGERYNMYGMTAAHKLLPFGTKVKVTNKKNGKSITVRINDRGPFVANRIIDLTKTGASKLDMIGPGTAPVLVETVGTVPGLTRKPSTAGSPSAGQYELSGRFYVQIGAFGSKANADGLVNRMMSSGYPSRTYYAEQVNFWRVQVGPYSTLTKAEEAADKLLMEYPQNFVVAE